MVGIEQFFALPVTIEPYLGQTGRGDESFGPAVQLLAWVEERRRRVRTADTASSPGDEQISEATVYAPIGTDCPTGSRITLPTGRVSYVLSTSRFVAAGLPLPEHLEILVA